MDTDRVTSAAAKTAPPVEETAFPELTYQTSETSHTIRRIRLDLQGLDLEVFFEIPHFEEPGAGYERINAFFVDLSDRFFSGEDQNLTNIWERACETGGELYDRWTAQVTFWNEKLVSVTLSEVWMAGGVKTYSSESYTFRTDTGELLSLMETVEGTEEELKAEILEALKRRAEPSDPEQSLFQAEQYALEDFQFSVDREGFIAIHFDSFELSRASAESDFSIYPYLMIKDGWRAREREEDR